MKNDGIALSSRIIAIKLTKVKDVAILVMKVRVLLLSIGLCSFALKDMVVVVERVLPEKRLEVRAGVRCNLLYNTL